MYANFDSADYTMSAQLEFGGTITDYNGGAGLEGVTVSWNSITVTTDINGYYWFYIPAGVEITLTISLDGYMLWPASQNLTWAPMYANFDSADYTMAAQLEFGGTITDYNGGAGLEGVTVSWNSITVTTDINGYYWFYIPAGVEITLTISLDGYMLWPASQDLTWAPMYANFDSADYAMRAITDHTASGTITCSETGDPLEGVKVSYTIYIGAVLFEDSFTLTDTNGYYSISVPDGAIFSITSISKEKYVPSSDNVYPNGITKSSSEIYDLEMDPDANDVIIGEWSWWWWPIPFIIGSLILIAFWCRDRPTVIGKVTHNGKGVKGVQISYTIHDQTEQSVWTDEGGYYRIWVVMDVDVRITGVTKEGFVPSATIDPMHIVEKETELNITLEQK